MNLSHGLLRAWLVVTALWIGFCGYRLVADWPPLGQFQVVMIRADLSNSDFAGTIPPERLAKFKEEAAAWHKQFVLAHILRIAMQAIFQPAALFASGFVVLWIARRFRKS